MDEDIQQEVETPETQTPELKKGRKSRKSLARQIDDCLLQVDADLSRGDQKPAYFNLRQSKLDTLRMLLEREDAQKKDAVLQENKTLTEQNQALLQELTSLKTTLSDIENRPPMKEVVIDTSAVTAAEARAARLAEACQVIPDRERVAMQVFIRLGERAANFLKVLDVDWQSWVRVSRTYRTREAMEQCVAACQNPTSESSAYHYCRLRLQVEFEVTQQDCNKSVAQRHREDFRICQEQIIREAREANLRQPSLGIAGGHRDLVR